ncbi:putative O-methyltransferase YrrM [Bradyrhizobium diazoefficiens]
MRIGDSSFRTAAEYVVDLIRMAAPDSKMNQTVCWDAFETLITRLNQVNVPSTTITAVMAHVLFAIAQSKRPAILVGAGTFVGYGFSYLVAGGLPGVSAFGCDVDRAANQIARRNAFTQGIHTNVNYADECASSFLNRFGRSIDLLFIDVDDPVEGKNGYAEIVSAAWKSLSPGALILAHDACVPKFKLDFEHYYARVEAHKTGEMIGMLPIDDCGISIAVKHQ